MYIKKDYGFNELLENSWSGAVDTLKKIRDEGKEEELIQYLEEIFCEETPDETTVNDFLWFDSDIIFEDLGILEEQEEGEDNE